MIAASASRAKEGVHRPLRVGSDEDQDAARRPDVSAWGDEEVDALRFDVMLVNLAELIVGDLADEAGAQAERGETGRGIARRAAADFACGAHQSVKPHRLGFVDQPHRALVERLGGDEGVVGDGDDIDDGIADAQHVEAGVGHGMSC